MQEIQDSFAKVKHLTQKAKNTDITENTRLPRPLQFGTPLILMQNIYDFSPLPPIYKIPADANDDGICFQLKWLR